MERVTPPPRGTEGAFTSEAMLALRGAAATGEPPLLLAYHPHFTTNPFQALLYSRAREHGLAPVAIDTEEQLAELIALQQAGIETVLHLHWLHLVLAEAESPEDAERRSGEFIEILEAHRRAGGRLVWTVHNILPHDTRFEAEEARLSEAVARRSDVVHVLTSRTADLVAPYYELPRDRLLHVPHPSYVGAYEEHVTRLDARHALGIMPDEFVFAVVGAIKPYKGLTGLLDAWQSVVVDRPMRLLIAGAPAEEPGVEALVARAVLDPTVLVDARTIPAPEMQLYLRAADVAVLPYLRALNSGALALALTFGLPVIVPDGGGLAEAVDERFARTVRTDDPAALREAIQDAPSWVTPAAGRAARARAEELAPSIVAERFAAGLRERLAARPAMRDRARPAISSTGATPASPRESERSDRRRGRPIAAAAGGGGQPPR